MGEKIGNQTRERVPRKRPYYHSLAKSFESKMDGKFASTPKSLVAVNHVSFLRVNRDIHYHKKKKLQVTCEHEPCVIFTVKAVERWKFYINVYIDFLFSFFLVIYSRH